MSRSFLDSYRRNLSLTVIRISGEICLASRMTHKEILGGRL